MMVGLSDVKRALHSIQVELDDVRRELAVRRWRRTTTKDGYNESEPRDAAGEWTSAGGVRVETSDGFYTGIQSIDQTSEALSDALISVLEKLEYLPSMSASAYGVAAHVAFGIAVRQLDLPGVGDIERSFSLDTLDPTYGMAGTVRTDVTLRNVQGEIVAIYDVKTGNARISASRADQLREVTRSAPGTPVFELNIIRGITRKSYGATRPTVCLLRMSPF